MLQRAEKFALNVFVGESGDGLVIIQLTAPTEAKELFPDMTITVASIQVVGKIAERPSQSSCDGADYQ